MLHWNKSWIRQGCWVWFFCLGLLFLRIPSAEAHPSIIVYLTLMEALEEDKGKPGYQLIQGLDRTQEPFSIAVPIPGDDDTPEFELNRFVLLIEGNTSKEPLVQFRLLKRWPNTRFRWLLVDGLSDLKANATDTLHYVYTGSARDLKKLATDGQDTITVDTGPAQFEISKTKFNLFHKVTVDGVTIVESGASPGVVLTGSDDVVYSSKNDTKVSVTVEENGPVKAVVLAKGSHVSSEGKDNLDFTVRMFFYKGKRRVRVFYSLRNASKRRVEHVSFKSLELQVKSNLKNSNFVVRNHEDESKGTLKDTEKVDVFQGNNNLNSIQDPAFTQEVWPTGIEGYTIKQDGNELKKGSREQPINLMYAQLVEGQDKSLTIGTRFGAGWWPQGLGLNGDGLVRVGVFPVNNDKEYTIRYRSHTTREHVFHFAKGVSNARDEFFKFQYPLVARHKDSDVINKRHALWERFASHIQEWDYYQRNKWPVDDNPNATLNRRPDLEFVRYVDWSLPGLFRNYDPAKIALHNFLRQDNRLQKLEKFAGGYYLMAEQRFQYYADKAIPHSDDFDGSKALEEVPALKGEDGLPLNLSQLPGGNKVVTANVFFHPNHLHGYGLSSWYYLTGDERIRKAYEAWGEHMKSQADKNNSGLGLAWNLFNWAYLFDFTDDKDFRTLAMQAVEKMVLPVSEPGKTGGTDWQRGFFVPKDQADREDRQIPTVVLGAILPNALGLLEQISTVHQDQDKLRSLQLGLARFMAEEQWTQYSDKPGEYGYLPLTAVDKAPAEDLRKSPDWQGGIQDVYMNFYFGYLLTGEASFLEKGKLLMKAAAHNPAGVNWYQDLPSRQTLQNMLENKEEFQVWRTLPLRVEKGSKPGSYTLHWTVPDFTVKYWLKYHTKTIVPSLGFDKATRKYKFDPTTHVPFFAATDVVNEPEPKKGGEAQSFTLQDLDPSKEYTFSVKYLSVDSSPPPKPPSAESVANEPNSSGDGGDNGDSGPEIPGIINYGCGGCSTQGGGSLIWFWLVVLFLGMGLRKRMG
ncbi:MAG: hypothetical protein EP343_16795 [Deltaproteobacteria bacterium]|nr:MAG: hypothetical protein EP343_16795 [Deltaproteobacteria bacterium]